MTAWILMISLWSGHTTEFHYFGTYKSQKQCNETAERIKAVTKQPQASLLWSCVEVPND